jgi:lipoprotein-releasing system permease protein
LFKYIKGGVEEFKGLNIILGGDVANQLRARVGDEITMIVPIVATTMFGVVPRAVNMKVVGLLRTNAQQYDNYMAIVPFKAGQAIFNLQEQASAIEVMTRNPNDIYDIELDILKVNEDKNVRLVDWYMENSALLNALNVEANVMALILSLFTIISMFTIFAIIRMMITSKEREIAILKSHGISNKQIRNIFLVVGMVVAVSGMALGNVIGIAVSLNIDNIRVAIEKIFGTKLLDGSVYFLANLPSRLMLADIIKTNIFALVMAFACTLISSRKSTKIDITATLRNN